MPSYRASLHHVSVKFWDLSLLRPALPSHLWHAALVENVSTAEGLAAQARQFQPAQADATIAVHKFFDHVKDGILAVRVVLPEGQFGSARAPREAYDHGPQEPPAAAIGLAACNSGAQRISCHTERHPTTLVADTVFVEHVVSRGPSFLVSLEYRPHAPSGPWWA